MASPRFRFTPIAGDEPFEDRVAAFNALGLGLNNLHDCMDTGFADAQKERQAIGDDLKELVERRNADAIAQEKWKETTVSHMRDTDEALKQISDNQSKDDARWERFNATAWRVVAAIGAIMLTAAIGTFLNAVFITKDTPTQADLAAKTASRYTADDASRDWNAQQQINHAILVCLSDHRKCKDPANDDAN